MTSGPPAKVETKSYSCAALPVLDALGERVGGEVVLADTMARSFRALIS